MEIMVNHKPIQIKKCMHKSSGTLKYTYMETNEIMHIFVYTVYVVVKYWYIGRISLKELDSPKFLHEN